MLQNGPQTIKYFSLVALN